MALTIAVEDSHGMGSMFLVKYNTIGQRISIDHTICHLNHETAIWIMTDIAPWVRFWSWWIDDRSVPTSFICSIRVQGVWQIVDKHKSKIGFAGISIIHANSTQEKCLEVTKLLRSILSGFTPRSQPWDQKINQWYRWAWWHHFLKGVTAKSWI